MAFKQTLNKGKDFFVGLLAKFFINNFKINRFGKMSNFSINSSTKEIILSLQLKGEEKTIDLRAKYHIESLDGKIFFCIDDAWTSREWLNEIFQIIPNDKKKMEIPPYVKNIVIDL